MYCVPSNIQISWTCYNVHDNTTIMSKRFVMNIGVETEVVEFKKSTSELKTSIVSIASILNKHRSGTLYFGVKDNGDVVGQQVGKDTQRDISRAIAGHIQPECHYEIIKRSTAEGADFIEVAFSGTNAPYSAYGLYYQRFADEDKRISDAQLERLFKERQKDYSVWENEVSSATVGDVDEALFAALIEEGNKSGHLKYAYKDLNGALKKFGLLSSDGVHLINAGNVLVSVHGPVMLKLATFATETKDTFVKLDHFFGNVYQCIEQGIDYIAQGIDYIVEFSGQSGRSEQPEIPLVAIREIVINAFAHGCYDANTTFEIDVFKDRVVVYSPGNFPKGYTPEDFASQAEKPIMLNPTLAEALFRTGKIESFGSGFERTFAACDKADVAYSYRNTKSGFEFTFVRPLGQNNVRVMSKTEQAVLSQLKGNNYATAKEVAATISKSEKTVYRAIRALKERGIIERVGNDYNGSWQING